MDSFTKQPSEIFFIEVDFAAVLGTGETITLGSSSASAVDRYGAADAAVLVGASLAVSGSKLQVQVRDGVVDKSAYKITMLAATSAGNIWEHDIQMKVAAL